MRTVTAARIGPRRLKTQTLVASRRSLLRRGMLKDVFAQAEKKMKKNLPLCASQGHRSNSESIPVSGVARL